MQPIQDERFERNVSWVVSILKTQDDLVLKAFRTGASRLVATEFFHDVLEAAMDHLAIHDHSTFRWALNHYDPELYDDLKQRTLGKVAHFLTQQGCIPGDDFSAQRGDTLLLKHRASQTLLGDADIWALPLIQDVLVPEA